MKGLCIQKKDGKVTIYLNGADITNQVLDISLHQKNGTFISRIDIPLSEVSINQDIKIM